MVAVFVANDLDAVRMATKHSRIRQYWTILRGAHPLLEVSEPLEAMLSLVESSLELISSRGSTLMHWACLAGDATLVKLLLDRNMPSTLLDHDGCTPWLIASRIVCRRCIPRCSGAGTYIRTWLRRVPALKFRTKFGDRPFEHVLQSPPGDGLETKEGFTEGYSDC
jgi:ankyrin repeat protein